MYITGERGLPGLPKDIAVDQGGRGERGFSGLPGMEGLPGLPGKPAFIHTVIVSIQFFCKIYMKRFAMIINLSF